MSRDDHRALRDASGRLLAALGRVSERCSIADRVTTIAHRLDQPGVRDGRDPVGLVFAMTEVAATLAEALEVALAEAASTPAVPVRKPTAVGAVA
jgi:hypothetical protein